MSCESPLTTSFLIPSSAAILRPASKPSYSAVLLVACSLGKCIWTTYLRCSPVGVIAARQHRRLPARRHHQITLATLCLFLCRGCLFLGLLHRASASTL